jgi:hypothetical protein
VTVPARATGPGRPAAIARLASRARPVTAAARDRLGAVLPWGLVVLAVLACAMMLQWPLGYDQGVFASVGDTVARGGAPYVDAWDVKGPVVFYAMALVQLVLGPHAWALRLVDVAVALATALLLHRRLRLLASPRIALAAAAMWPLAVAAMTWDESLQPDLWAGSAMLAVAFAMTRPEGYRVRELAIAGAAVGLLTMLKPVYAACLVVPAAAIVARHGTLRGAALRDMAIVAAGLAAALLAVLAALAAQGALDDMWAVYIRYNLEVYAPAVGQDQVTGIASLHSIATRIWGLAAWLAEPRVLALVPAVLAGAVALRRRAPTVAWVVLAWTATAIGLVVLQNKFFPYHWALVHPALLVLAACGVHALALESRATGSPVIRGVTVAIAASALTLWLAQPVRDLRRWGLHAAGLRSAAQYDATLVEVSEISPASELAAARWLRDNTAPGTPFLQWTINAGLAYHAQRPHLVRFHNKRELLRTRGHPITEAYRAEVLRALVQRRPAHVVLGEGLGRDRTVLAPLAAIRAEFPELAAVVERDYVRVRSFGDLEIWRRRSEPARAAAP